MLKWIKEYIGWNDLTEEVQHEKKCLIFAYCSGFVTALFLVAIIRGGGLL